MKTEDVYFTMTRIVTKVDTTFHNPTGEWIDMYNHYEITHEKHKTVLVLHKTNKYYGKTTFKDLYTNKLYLTEISTEVGTVFIDLSLHDLIKFNDFTGNTKENLSKRKIKKIIRQKVLSVNKKEE